MIVFEYLDEFEVRLVFFTLIELLYLCLKYISSFPQWFFFLHVCLTKLLFCDLLLFICLFDIIFKVTFRVLNKLSLGIILIFKLHIMFLIFSLLFLNNRVFWLTSLFLIFYRFFLFRILSRFFDLANSQSFHKFICYFGSLNLLFDTKSFINEAIGTKVWVFFWVKWILIILASYLILVDKFIFAICFFLQLKYREHILRRFLFFWYLWSC